MSKSSQIPGNPYQITRLGNEDPDKVCSEYDCGYKHISKDHSERLLRYLRHSISKVQLKKATFPSITLIPIYIAYMAKTEALLYHNSKKSSTF